MNQPMKKLLVLYFLTYFSSMALAQNGFLRGRVIEEETGEGLIGANIYVEGTTNGTVADFNGDYSLPLAPGTYTIVFSSISYTTVKVTDILIKAGEVTNLDITMKSAVEQLEGVVVTAEVARNAESGLLVAQKKSMNITDGISNQAFKKTGDSDLSGAIKRVTGVSVEGGKYVYVRGLGDRYTKTTLNGMDIPGLDPDRNSVQIDIFPTAVLDNVMVYKTFTPNMYGDFSGGVVDIATRDFPEEPTTSFSVGLSVIPGVQFNDNFILYKGGRLDWLGFDDGTRALPFAKNTAIPPESQVDPALEQLTRSFNPVMAARRRQALPGGSFTFTKGNQFNRDKVTFGYNLVLNYNNNFEFYTDAQSNDYLKDPDLSVNEPFFEEHRIGDIGKQTVNWSGLLSGAVKADNYSISIGLLRSQSGESVANKRTSRNFNQTGATLLEDVLTYTQRSVTNAIVVGKHKLKEVQVEWRGAANWSRVYDPDFRVTSISITDGDTSLNVGDGAGINRFYRDLNEFNGTFKADVIVPVAAKSKIKFGGLTTYKKRYFEVLNYIFRQRNAGSISTDPDWFFQPENIWTADTRTGTYVVGNYEPANTYLAQQLIYSGYAMGELTLAPAWKAIIGLRAEQAMMYYTGQNNGGDIIYDTYETLNNLNLLPSANLVYALNEDMNLRLSYNKTLARPSFKEKSIAQIFDPITNRTFVGNIDLKQTDINNFDFRWEYYLAPGEIFAVSAYYKTFANHIELVSFPVDPATWKPRNAGSGWVYGIELEARKNLDFVSPALKDLTLGANLSVIRSFVDMNTILVDNNNTETEKELRERFKRDGETIKDTRPMAGQAPYLVNAYLNYLIDEWDMNINLAYNVQGPTLTVVGTAAVPDVYTVPFHSLNFNVFKNFGAERKSRLTFGINNLLNDKREQVYRSYGADDKLFYTFNPGRQLSLKYSYTF